MGLERFQLLRVHVGDNHRGLEGTDRSPPQAEHRAARDLAGSEAATLCGMVARRIELAGTGAVQLNFLRAEAFSMLVLYADGGRETGEEDGEEG